MQLSLIVPCYNEEEVIELFYNKVRNVLYNILDYEIIFVDDGSKDKTKKCIINLAQNDSNIKYISFSRNFGKESAMLAGMEYSMGDYVAIIDADLQHPPELLIEMIKALENGYDVAAAKRVDRKGEKKIKSFFSHQFYFIINKLIDIKIEQGAQDFRVMKRKVVKSIISMQEYNRFSKGIFSWVGFKTKWFEHENVERLAGNSKWSFTKLFKYAVDGIVAFSVVPLKMALVFGVITSIIGFFYAFKIIIDMLFNNFSKTGYTSIMSCILIIGGIILICIGLLGEYISRIYLEVKRRPTFIVDETNINFVKSKHEENFVETN